VQRLLLLLALEDLLPVEPDVGMVLFDQPDRVLVQSRAADPDAGRCTEPVQNAVS
jgi:hypothetical protein